MKRTVSIDSCFDCNDHAYKAYSVKGEPEIMCVYNSILGTSIEDPSKIPSDCPRLKEVE